ncbi:HtpX-like protease protein [Actinoplanes sp. SE50]|uniref:M48 family metalloprotease n=1 Tax=unclassified Actinoplanes TaxID=2626549 RepID=UPI00023ECB17|nr:MULTISPECIES: M48 family metalloprotease [unclassified Actinoplanes]AEV84279.1 HtpX-like probable protease protein [Actinoplanes sp. SE50/110]ATO82671.1 HtpX-like protease protein [Actinoplanes sp. SE50]SLM00078.1 HtpX-like protease [Actinoplanes sp. SE50/110]
MTVAIYLPLLLALPLASIAPRVAGRGTPGPAARLLAATAAVAAVSSTWSLTMLALTMLDDVPPLSVRDDSPGLELPEPVPGPVALLAGVLLLGAGVRLLVDVRRRWTTHRRLRAVGEVQDGLVIADWAKPMAVAVPGAAGRPGHLLVTTGILRLLDADERRVLFAHEQAHLEHRHHRLVAVAAAAAALNPLLIPVRDAVAYLVERWADEEAAAHVGDRRLTAKAVARAALAGSGPEPGTALGIDGGAVVRRVRALGQATPATLRRRLIAPALLAAGFLAVAAVATEAFVDLAQAWV